MSTRESVGGYFSPPAFIDQKLTWEVFSKSVSLPKEGGKHHGTLDPVVEVYLPQLLTDPFSFTISLLDILVPMATLFLAVLYFLSFQGKIF